MATCTMSYNKKPRYADRYEHIRPHNYINNAKSLIFHFGLILFLLGSSDVLASPARCPAKLGGHLLDEAGLFDGNPSDLAELVPGDGGWKLNIPASSPEGYFLGCRYKKTSRTISVRIDPDAKFCSFEGHNVSCR